MREMPPKAKAYWDKAKAFVTANGGPETWNLINAANPEFEAWVRYFASQGWEPWMMRQLRQGTIEHISVPAKWPEWFDSDYAPAVAAE